MRSKQINQIDKINCMLKKQKCDKKICDFFSDIEADDIECVMIGGAIRDAINGRTPRDIDLIINIEDPKKLEWILEKNCINYQKNVFNGYKLYFSKDIYDVWLMKDHYSFKQNFYQAELKYLKETTFTNYDSLIYDIKRKNLEINYYQKCVAEKRIDFVGDEKVIKNNPMPCMNVMKILKTKKETSYELSEGVQSYLWEFYKMNKERYHKMLEAEYRRHYQQEMDIEFSNYIYQYFRNQATISWQQKK